MTSDINTHSGSEELYEKKYNPSIGGMLSFARVIEQRDINSRPSNNYQQSNTTGNESYMSSQPTSKRLSIKNSRSVLVMNESEIDELGGNVDSRQVLMNRSRNDPYHSAIRQSSYRDEEPFDVSNDEIYARNEANASEVQNDEEVEEYDYQTGVDESKKLDFDGEENEYYDGLDDSYHIKTLESDPNITDAGEDADDDVYEDGEYEDDMENILRVYSEDVEDKPTLNIFVHCINSSSDYKSFSDNASMIDKSLALDDTRTNQQTLASSDTQWQGDVMESNDNLSVNNDSIQLQTSTLRSESDMGDERQTSSAKGLKAFCSNVGAEDIQRKSPISPKQAPAANVTSLPESMGKQLEKLLEEDFDTELSWRLDPSISLSDWTVEVVVTDQRGDWIHHYPIERYCVHKSVLAVGPRRSAFFVKEFKLHAAEKKAAAEAEKQRAMMLLERLERQHEQNREAAHLLLDNDTSNVFDMHDNPFARLAAVGCNLIGAPLQNLIQMEKSLANHQCGSPGSSTVLVPATSLGPTMNQPSKSRSTPQVPFSKSDLPSTPLPKQIDVIKSSTTLELQKLAAETFPFALDFIYSSTGKLDISTEHASALYYLSKKLDVKSLQHKVEQFWKADMTIDTVLVYYQHGRQFKDNAIIAAAELLCAHHLLELSDDVVVDLLATVDAPFMCNVVAIVAHEELSRHASYPQSSTDPSSNEELNKFYLQLSLLIAVYCNIHRRALSPEMFWKLTHERQLPVLEAKAAKALLDVQSSIVGPNSELTSLTARCVTVLADNWSEMCASSTGQLSLNRTIVSSNRDFEEKDDKDYESGRASPNNTITDESKSNAVDAPKLVGEAMEEFVALALTNAKNQINRLEQEKAEYDRENYALRNEIELLKLQLTHGDLQRTRPVGTVLVKPKPVIVVNDMDSDCSSVRSTLNAKAASHFSKMKQRSSKIPIISQK